MHYYNRSHSNEINHFLFSQIFVTKFGDGMPRMQKVKFPSTENPEPSKVLSSKFEVTQNKALHVPPAARDSVSRLSSQFIHSTSFCPFSKAVNQTLLAVTGPSRPLNIK